MSRDTQIHEVEAEIDRLSAELVNMQEGPSTQTRSWPDCEQSIASVNRELASMRERKRAEPSYDFDRYPPPKLPPFDERSNPTKGEQTPRGEKPRRKEIEARRYSGKESVNEYLLQFELTAKRNNWTDTEKAINLLCALDGPARNVLSESA